VDGGDGRFGKKRLFDAGDLQVVVEVALHILAIHPSSGSEPRPGKTRGETSVEEFIEKVVLSAKTMGAGFRVGLELSEGVEFQEDFQSEQEAHR